MFGMNSFAKRQTSTSPYSHFAGTEQELLALVEANWANRKPGYRDGVVLVPIPANGFFSAVVELDDKTELVASFEARREGEDKFITVRAKGQKSPAKVVDIVLYSRETLLEEGPDAAETGQPWEVVSINARPTEAPEPMHPVAMARNFLELAGGTKADYSAKEFAEAIMYWGSRAMAA